MKPHYFNQSGEEVLLLRDHILDQKRRYQSVVLNCEQAVLILKIIEGSMQPRKKQDTDSSPNDPWRWGGG